MKKRVTTVVEITKYPLIMLLVAAFFIAAGNLLSSTFIFGENLPEYLLKVSTLFTGLGSFLTVNLPIVLLIAIVGSYFPKDSYAIFVAVIGFIAFNVTTMIFAPMGMDPNAYTPELGIFFDINFTTDNPATIIFPLQLGIVGAILSGFVTFAIYRRYSQTNLYGNLSFLNHKILTMVIIIFVNILFGLMVAMIWPFVVDMIVNFNNFVGEDISSGTKLFVYGFVDRVLSVFQLADITHANFWFSDLGGSVLIDNATSVSGDILMWTHSMTTGRLIPLVGKFITPYYLINLFMMPAVILAIYSHNTNRFERGNQLVLVIFIILIVMVSGNSLPIELFLLVTMPLFFFVHIFIVALLFALLMKFNIVIGHSVTSESLQTVYPGNLLEFLRFSQVDGAQQTTIVIIVIGLVLGVIYFFSVRYFLKNGSMLPVGQKALPFNVDELITAVGGVDNIVDVDASVSKLAVHLMDVRLIDIEKVAQLGAISIHQTRTGYSFNFGTASRLIRDEMLKSTKH